MATRWKDEFVQRHWTNLNKLVMFQKQKERLVCLEGNMERGSASEERPASRKAGGNLKDFGVSKAQKEFLKGQITIYFKTCRGAPGWLS